MAQEIESLKNKLKQTQASSEKAAKMAQDRSKMLIEIELKCEQEIQ
jgi:hypothetical protein